MDDLKSNRARTALKAVRRSLFWVLAEGSRVARIFSSAAVIWSGNSAMKLSLGAGHRLSDVPRCTA